MGKAEASAKLSRQRSIVAYKQQARPGIGTLAQQKTQKILSAVSIESRGRFVGHDQWGSAHQGASESYPLLLPHRKPGHALAPQVAAKAKVIKQMLS